eukprot:scaffold132_cov170-Amphora_coffeaeformis.AAC.28
MEEDIPNCKTRRVYTEEQKATRRDRRRQATREHRGLQHATELFDKETKSIHNKLAYLRRKKNGGIATNAATIEQTIQHLIREAREAGQPLTDAEINALSQEQVRYENQLQREEALGVIESGWNHYGHYAASIHGRTPLEPTPATFSPARNRSLATSHHAPDSVARNLSKSEHEEDLGFPSNTAKSTPKRKRTPSKQGIASSKRNQISRSTTPGGAKPKGGSKTTGLPPRPSSSSAREKTPPPVLQVEPEFAMMTRNDEDGYTTDNVLAIGQGHGDWSFRLEDHIKSILEEHPGRDMYLVGYRNEERPNLFGGHERVRVPFFAVHTLAAGTPPPASLAFSDLENMTEQHVSVACSPFTWDPLHEFPTGEKVHMLRFVGRTTKHSSTSLATLTCGAMVYFANGFDSKQNPGDAFQMKLDGEDYFFSAEVWDLAKPKLKEALKESPFDNWFDCCLGAKKDVFLAIIVPIALAALFEYYEDDGLEGHQDALNSRLSETFWAFRNQVKGDEKKFREMEVTGCTANQATHFKIYPDNAVLRSYLSAGKNDWISKWAGNASDVYPRVRHDM